MTDKGMARAVGRELFGLIVRLAGLWLAIMSGITFCTLVSSRLSSDAMVVWALVGLGVGLWMIVKADFVCRLSYGVQRD